MGTTKPNDAEILSNVIEALDTNANHLNNKLGYSSPSSIYHILQNRNKISKSLRNKIIEAYPQVNALYLSKGELPILLNQEKAQGQANFFNSGVVPAVGMEDVPELLKDIKNLLQLIVYKMEDKK